MKSIDKPCARLGALLLAIGVASGCSSGSTSSSGAKSDAASPTAVSSDSGSSTSDPYPDWAAAVVPDYPNVLDQSSIAGRLYQIDTADDPAIVLAWYKAHVSGGTWVPSDPDTPKNRWNVKAHGVDIDIEENSYPGNLPAAKTVKTMIALTQEK